MFQIILNYYKPKILNEEIQNLIDGMLICALKQSYIYKIYLAINISRIANWQLI